MNRATNINIKQLIKLLTSVSSVYETVDLVFDPENKKLIIEPVKSSKLTDYEEPPLDLEEYDPGKDLENLL